jgi:hypothetical protein
MSGVLSRQSSHKPVLKGHESVLKGHESVLEGNESVLKGHEAVLKGHESVLKGHGFSRAAKCPIDRGALAPEGRFAQIEWCL